MSLIKEANYLQFFVLLPSSFSFSKLGGGSDAACNTLQTWGDFNNATRFSLKILSINNPHVSRGILELVTWVKTLVPLLDESDVGEFDRETPVDDVPGKLLHGVNPSTLGSELVDSFDLRFLYLRGDELLLLRLFILKASKTDLLPSSQLSK